GAGGSRYARRRDRLRAARGSCRLRLRDERDLGRQQDAPRLAVAHLETSAQRLDALGEPAQTEASGAREVGRQPDAVVRDGYGDALVVAVHVDLYARRMAVPQRIDQPLLHDPIDRQRNAVAEIAGEPIARGQRYAGAAALPVADEVLEGLAEPERVERERLEPRNQAVHRVVETRRLVRDQPRGLDALRRRFGPGRDRERETADGRHRLAELVVQLVRDQTPLLLDALLDQPAELAPFLEPRLRLARLALGGDFVLDSLRH